MNQKNLARLPRHGICSNSVLKNPVTVKQLVDAVNEWNVRFPVQRDESELVMLADFYYRDLVDAHVSEKEFELLRGEIGKRSKWFPTVADILACRDIFYLGSHEPTQADIEAGQIDPNYKHGKPFLIEDPEMVAKIQEDYEQPRIARRSYAKLINLKSIK